MSLFVTMIHIEHHQLTCTVYTVHCKVYNVQCTLYIIHCTYTILYADLFPLTLLLNRHQWRNRYSRTSRMREVRSSEGPQKMKKFIKKTFFKTFFPKFVLSSHLLVNLPKKMLNLRPLDKISLKNSFLVEKSHFFCKIFPGHFLQKYDLRAGGPLNWREGRKIAVTPLIGTVNVVNLSRFKGVVSLATTLNLCSRWVILHVSMYTDILCHTLYVCIISYTILCCMYNHVHGYRLYNTLSYLRTFTQWPC